MFRFFFEFSIWVSSNFLVFSRKNIHSKGQILQARFLDVFWLLLLFLVQSAKKNWPQWPPKVGSWTPPPWEWDYSWVGGDPPPPGPFRILWQATFLCPYGLVLPLHFGISTFRHNPVGNTFKEHFLKSIFFFPALRNIFNPILALSPCHRVAAAELLLPLADLQFVQSQGNFLYVLPAGISDEGCVLS